MKKIILATTFFFCLQFTTAHADDFGNSFTDDLQLGVGIGMLDLGMHDSAPLFYATAQKELDILLGDFDYFTHYRVGKSGDASTAGSNINFDYFLSALIKGRLYIQNNFSSQDMAAYGVIGLSLAGITDPVDSYNDLSFTYGFGLEWDIADQMKVGTEYTNYSLRADAFAVTLTYGF